MPPPTGALPAAVCTTTHAHGGAQGNGQGTTALATAIATAQGIAVSATLSTAQGTTHSTAQDTDQLRLSILAKFDSLLAQGDDKQLARIDASLAELQLAQFGMVCNVSECNGVGASCNGSAGHQGAAAVQSSIDAIDPPVSLQ